MISCSEISIEKLFLRKPALRKMSSYLEADEPVMLSMAQEQRMLLKRLRACLALLIKIVSRLWLQEQRMNFNVMPITEFLI